MEYQKDGVWLWMLVEETHLRPPICREENFNTHSNLVACCLEPWDMAVPPRQELQLLLAHKGSGKHNSIVIPNLARCRERTFYVCTCECSSWKIHHHPKLHNTEIWAHPVQLWVPQRDQHPRCLWEMHKLSWKVMLSPVVCFQHLAVSLHREIWLRVALVTLDKRKNIFI